jgi:hypothetical protein
MDRQLGGRMTKQEGETHASKVLAEREKKPQDTAKPRTGLMLFIGSSMAMGALMLSKRLGKGHEL